MQRTIRFAVRGCLLACVVSACSGNRPAPILGPAPIATPRKQPTPHLPTGLAALTYDTAPHLPEAPSTNQVEPWIRQVVEKTQGAQPAFTPHPDARLDRLAFDVTFALEQQPNPDAELVDQLLSHYGIPNPSPAFLLFRSQVASDPTSMEPLREQIIQTIRQGEFRRYGFGLRQVATGWIGVLAFVEQGVDLDPIPRMLTPGQSVLISGRLLPPFSAPEVLLTPSMGPVRTLTKVDQGVEFKTRLKCTQTVGSWRVEVLGSDASGPVVLANFPLYCGVMPPQAQPWAASAATPEPNPLQVEQRLFQLVGEARKQHGLPPLAHHPGLSQIARKYSQEMAESQAVAHFSKQSGSVVDRVRASGMMKKPTVLAENVGRAYSAREAHQGFMASPGHRANLLHTMPTQIGIGVVRGGRAGEHQAFYITQIFAAF